MEKPPSALTYAPRIRQIPEDISLDATLVNKKNERVIKEKHLRYCASVTLANLQSDVPLPLFTSPYHQFVTNVISIDFILYEVTTSSSKNENEGTVTSKGCFVRDSFT